MTLPALRSLFARWVARVGATSQRTSAMRTGIAVATAATVTRHIVRWADDEDLCGRTVNGVLHCLHDKAFERGDFTVGANGRVRVKRQGTSRWAERWLNERIRGLLRVGSVPTRTEFLAAYRARVLEGESASPTEVEVDENGTRHRQDVGRVRGVRAAPHCLTANVSSADGDADHWIRLSLDPDELGRPCRCGPGRRRAVEGARPSGPGRLRLGGEANPGVARRGVSDHHPRAARPADGRPERGRAASG